MRISDWSSDVCSSDLADHGEGVVAAEIAGPLARSDGLLAGVDQVGVDLVLGRERADAEQAVLRLQPHVHAVGDVVGHQRRQADAKVDVHAVRSEEHTSELQSLMRNSYAVFCLKK